MTPPVPNIRLEALAGFRKMKHPASITNFAKHWPAMRWTLESIRDIGPNRPVVVQTGRNSSASYEVDSASHTERMQLRTFIEMLMRGEHTNDYYMTARNMADNAWLAQALRPDVPACNVPAMYLWVGPGGTLTPWHHDECDVMLAQLTGYKQVYCVTNEHSHLMRRNAKVSWSSDWGVHELRPGPKHGQKPPVLFTLLGPGDGLYLPKGTWHRVEALSTSISASWCEKEQ